MKTGHRIKLMRLLFGMTQEELASLAGISRPSLINYEQGGYSPIDDIVIRLAKIFGVEPGYLRYGSPLVKNQVWIPNIPRHSQRKQNIIDELLKLLPEFILENSFTGVVAGSLADGGLTLLFGRDTHYDCLLLTNTELGEKLVRTVNGIIHHKIEDNTFGTVESFDEDCLSFVFSQIEKIGFELAFIPMRQSLTRLQAIKTRTVTNLDAVTLEFAAENDKLIRERLLRVADIICQELIGGISLEQLVSEQKQNRYLPTLDVLSYSDPVSKTFCVILKAAYDLLATEQKISRSFPPNP